MSNLRPVSQVPCHAKLAYPQQEVNDSIPIRSGNMLACQGKPVAGGRPCGKERRAFQAFSPGETGADFSGRGTPGNCIGVHSPARNHTRTTRLSASRCRRDHRIPPLACCSVSDAIHKHGNRRSDREVRGNRAWTFAEQRCSNPGPPHLPWGTTRRQQAEAGRVHASRTMTISKNIFWQA